jgi:hypothetical protein
MMRPLRLLMVATDLGFLIYWSAATLLALGLIEIPPEALFSNYRDATVAAWNWSFLPLDLLLSLSGLASVIFARIGDARWRIMAVLSLTMTFCAGLMALSFWAARCEFSPAWWAFNGFLLAYPPLFLFKLTAEDATDVASRI